ncbi:MAG: deoxyribodipyrimidine photo-lyase [Elusimicrobia bacterium]|nr:deoxyribodipyrimidine photo-lyase [Elusimicrobiota bacterium]
MVKSERIYTIQDGKPGQGPVVYWMSRDQRAEDNWALLYAQEYAIKNKKPLVAVFCLVPEFLGATIRQYDFMIKGLQSVEKKLQQRSIPFMVLPGHPTKTLPQYLKKINAGILITDFDPLRVKIQWKKNIQKRISMPFLEVDAHNIVPCRYASQKQEFGAYTIRPKILKNISKFLDPFPRLVKHPHHHPSKHRVINWQSIIKQLRVDTSVKPVSWIKPGEDNAKKQMNHFIKTHLISYDQKRNDPNLKAQSNLSPYLHFGQIAAQRIVLEIKKRGIHNKSSESFIEELVVRKELSDNFCLYNEQYDSCKGFPSWAQKTLNEMRKSKRPYLYSCDRFDQAATHDALWNAAQRQMKQTGKMHGYMRMYWAKKILEWTKSPEDALAIAIQLNDIYELDGRDPNGYAGIAWSIGGVHDRAWFPRPVFGKIRYMSYNGCASKFDVPAYIQSIP